MAQCVSPKLIMSLLAVAILSPYLMVHAKKSPTYIVLYAHESRVAPTNTIIVSASPTGNFSGADQFGLIRTVSNVLRKSPRNDSTILGSQVGIVAVGLNSGPVYISFTYFLNANATHQGTLAVHGHIDGTSTVDRAFAVVGGTGDFLSATGVDKSKYDNGSPLIQHVVNIHNISLTYPPHRD